MEYSELSELAALRRQLEGHQTTTDEGYNSNYSNNNSGALSSNNNRYHTQSSHDLHRGVEYGQGGYEYGQGNRMLTSRSTGTLPLHLSMLQSDPTRGGNGDSRDGGQVPYGNNNNSTGNNSNRMDGGNVYSSNHSELNTPHDMRQFTNIGANRYRTVYTHYVYCIL